jgi:hypothetical protein
MSVAEAIFAGIRTWLIIGSLVAALFLSIGIDRIDEDAQGAYAFRPLLVPGILLIWPLVLWRWWVLEAGREVALKRYAPPRAAHGLIAGVMCGLIIALFALGLSQRQIWPADIAPERLPDISGASQ